MLLYVDQLKTEIISSLLGNSYLFDLSLMENHDEETGFNFSGKR